MVDVTDDNDWNSELNQFIESMADNAQAQRALMSSEERLMEFLVSCNHRGSKYRPGNRQWPNHSRLSQYCGCAPSTILRLESGGTKFASRAILETLNAIACISPPACGDDHYEEVYARIADADRWVSSDPGIRGEIWPAIRTGITARITARIAISKPASN